MKLKIICNGASFKKGAPKENIWVKLTTAMLIYENCNRNLIIDGASMVAKNYRSF